MEADDRFSAASFKDSMEERGIAAENDLIALIDNMAELVETMAELHWKTRELVFYIDAC